MQRTFLLAALSCNISPSLRHTSNNCSSCLSLASLRLWRHDYVRGSETMINGWCLPTQHSGQRLACWRPYEVTSQRQHAVFLGNTPRASLAVVSIFFQYFPLAAEKKSTTSSWQQNKPRPRSWMPLSSAFGENTTRVANDDGNNTCRTSWLTDSHRRPLRALVCRLFSPLFPPFPFKRPCPWHGSQLYPVIGTLPFLGG